MVLARLKENSLGNRGRAGSTNVYGSHEQKIERSIDNEIDTLLASIPPHVNLLKARVDLKTSWYPNAVLSAER